MTLIKNFEKSEKTLLRLNLLMQAIGIGTWDWDLTSNEVIWGDTMYNLYGIQKNNYESDYQAWEKTIHPEDKLRMVEFTSRAIESGDFVNTKFRIINNEGFVRHISSNLYIDRDAYGKAIQVFGLNWDITNEVTTQERLKLAMSSADVGIWDWDLLNSKLVWDDKMFELYGYKPNKVIPTIDLWKQAVHADDIPKIWNEVQSSLNNVVPFSAEFRAVTFNGEIRHLAAKGKVTCGRDGKAIRLTGINWDITHRKQAEHLLEQQRAILANSLKMASLGEMAGGIAHEINNPLAIIKGKCEQACVLLNQKPIDEERLKKTLGDVDRTVDRISKIINGLRSFSRNAEKDPMVISQISKIIEETLELCKARFKHNDIELRVNILTDGFVFCRPSQLSQVIMNLLGNAHDAVESLPEKWVELKANKVGSNIEICVTDSGGGIPFAVVEKMMLPFFTTKELNKGTGLGLSISHGIVQEHKGVLRYDKSSINTRFVVQLPIQKSVEGYV